MYTHASRRPRQCRKSLSPKLPPTKATTGAEVGKLSGNRGPKGVPKTSPQPVEKETGVRFRGRQGWGFLAAETGFCGATTTKLNRLFSFVSGESEMGTIALFLSFRSPFRQGHRKAHGIVCSPGGAWCIACGSGLAKCRKTLL